jgi:hypothetical protein
MYMVVLAPNSCSVKPHEVIVYASLPVKLCNEFIVSSKIEYVKMTLVLSNSGLTV